MRRSVLVGILWSIVASTPGHADQRLIGREAWRISGQDDRFLFGVVSRVIADQEGNVYLLDSQLSEVTVLDASGAFRRRIGGEGDGPGGLRLPADLFLYSNGDVGVVMLSPAKIVRFDSTGTFLGDVTPTRSGQPLRLLNAAATTDGLVGIGIQSQFAPGSRTTAYVLSLLDAGGRVTTELVQGAFTLSYESLHIDERALDVPEARWTVAPDGRVFVAPDRDAYRVVVFDATGTRLREWSFPFTAAARNEEGRAQVEADLHQLYRHARYQRATFEVAETDPVITSMRLSDDGDLWITTTRAAGTVAADTSFVVMDVVSETGRRLGRLSLDVPGHADEDALHWLSDDRVVVVESLASADRAMSGMEGGDGRERAPDIVCYDVGVAP